MSKEIISLIFCFFLILSLLIYGSSDVLAVGGTCICQVPGHEIYMTDCQKCKSWCEAEGDTYKDCIDKKDSGRDSGTSYDAGRSSGSTLTNPLGETKDIPTLIGKIISAILGVVGSIALAIFVYGGFLWMTSAGNSEQVNKGKETLIWATIGLAVIFAAYALVSFVIKAIGA